MSPFPVLIHHNPDCGTSRNVLGIIRAAGYKPTVIDLLERPPPGPLAKEDGQVIVDAEGNRIA